MNYLDGTNRCFPPAVSQISTVTQPIDTYQKTTLTQNRTIWFHVSTVQAVNPKYVYQYKSGTERLQALMGRLSQRQCR